VNRLSRGHQGTRNRGLATHCPRDSAKVARLCTFRLNLHAGSIPAALAARLTRRGESVGANCHAADERQEVLLDARTWAQRCLAETAGQTTDR